MISINPHVNFNWNAQEAFSFYQSIFGGECTKVIHFGDLASDEFPVSESEKNKLMSIALPIGSTFLMWNDVPEAMGKTNENENRSKIYISVDSKEEAEKIYNWLSVWANVEYPMWDDAWDARFAMLRDKYGVEWMIEFDPSN